MVLRQVSVFQEHTAGQVQTVVQPCASRPSDQIHQQPQPKTGHCTHVRLIHTTRLLLVPFDLSVTLLPKLAATDKLAWMDGWFDCRVMRSESCVYSVNVFKGCERARRCVRASLSVVCDVKVKVTNDNGTTFWEIAKFFVRERTAATIMRHTENKQ